MTARTVLVVVILALLPAATQAQKRTAASNAKSTEQRAKAHATAKAKGEAALNGAQNILELSRLIGTVPNRCERLDDTSRVCSWEISNRMPGYGVLAPVANTTNRVFVICELPNDNSERKPDGCTVSAAGRPAAAP